MPIVKCKLCSTKFYAKPFWVKRGFGNYCSAKCQHLGRRTGKMVRCFICGKEVYKQLKALKHSQSKKYFCSKSCQTKWRNAVFIGKKHANWKHGEYAYKSILLRHKVIPKCLLCQVEDRRVLAVHHVDGNHKNNRLANLTWLCHNCHHLVHSYEPERKKMMEALV